MKDDEQWAKTFLIAYKYLPHFCRSIDGLVKKEGISSQFISVNNLAMNDVFGVSNTIIKLSEKKVNYINLKIRISESLKKIDSNHSKILILKYVYGMTISELSKLYNCSERSICRRVNTALQFFKEAIISPKYSFNAVCKDLEDKWLYAIYQKNISFLNSEDLLETLSINLSNVNLAI